MALAAASGVVVSGSGEERARRGRASWWRSVRRGVGDWALRAVVAMRVRGWRSVCFVGVKDVAGVAVRRMAKKTDFMVLL